MNQDFYTPQRQAWPALLILVLRSFQQLLGYFWPFLLFWLIRGKVNTDSFLLWVAIPSVFIQALRSSVLYFRTHYYLLGTELILEKGFLYKSRVGIPFERVQSISLDQPFLHGLLGVVKFSVDTAGSGTAEMVLDAIDKQKAEALRDFVLAEKLKLAISDTSETEESSTRSLEPVESEVLILRRTEKDLFRIGLGQNHLQTFGVVLGFFLSLFREIRELFNFEEGELAMRVFSWASMGRFTWLITGIMVILLFSLVLSMVNVFIRYFDFSLWLKGSRLRWTSGLFNKTEQNVQLDKIQWIRWDTDPFKRLFRMYNLRLYQTDENEVRKKQARVIPGCSLTEVDRFREMIFAHPLPVADERIHPAIVARRIIFCGFWPVLAGIGLLIWGLYIPAFFLGVVLFFVILSARTFYKRFRYGIDEKMLYVRSGAYFSKEILIPLLSVQGVAYEQSPFQRKRGLANLIVLSASGTISLPYISLDKALYLYDYLLMINE